MLPSIKTVIDTFGLKPDKSLGQNFLLDKSITDTIVTAAGDIENKVVVEVGPGPGLLSRSILDSKIKELHALEMDSRCIEALESLKELHGDRFKLIHADASKFDFNSLSDGKLTVIANLPYNIGTFLLLKWLETPQKFDQIVIMLQKEVVDRIVAKENDKSYGRLSVICNMLCDVEILMDVDRTSFYPPPKVQSAVVKLKPLKNPRFDCNIASLQKVTAAAFGMRRKMLRQSLKPILGDRINKLEEIGISLTQRAETISLKQFYQITKIFDGQNV